MDASRAGACTSRRGTLLDQDDESRREAWLGHVTGTKSPRRQADRILGGARRKNRKDRSVAMRRGESAFTFLPVLRPLSHQSTSLSRSYRAAFTLDRYYLLLATAACWLLASAPPWRKQSPDFVVFATFLSLVPSFLSSYLSFAFRDRVRTLSYRYVAFLSTVYFHTNSDL